MNRGWRFCRQGQSLYLVDSSCFLVGATPPLFPVLVRRCSQVVPTAAPDSCRHHDRGPSRRAARDSVLHVVRRSAIATASRPPSRRRPAVLSFSMAACIVARNSRPARSKSRHASGVAAGTSASIHRESDRGLSRLPGLMSMGPGVNTSWIPSPARCRVDPAATYIFPSWTIAPVPCRP